MVRAYLHRRRSRSDAAVGHLRTKRLFVQTGEVIPERALWWLLEVFNHVHVGWWLKRQRFPVRALVDSRERVFDLIALESGDRRVLYLEFGVADGASMLYWSRLLSNPQSMLHGFDSFEGLPTQWAPGRPAGSFSLNRVPPTFPDRRVRLFTGWFTETLPRYEWPAGFEQLIVTLDADLYTSTACVLQAIEERIEVGTVLYFDEFHHYADELRAFDELLSRTGWSFEILAATSDFSQVAFRRVK